MGKGVSLSCLLWHPVFTDDRSIQSKALDYRLSVGLPLLKPHDSAVFFIGPRKSDVPPSPLRVAPQGLFFKGWKGMSPPREASGLECSVERWPDATGDRVLGPA